jgi:hypothetical protein
MSKADHVQRCRKRTQDAGRQSRARSWLHLQVLVGGVAREGGKE